MVHWALEHADPSGGPSVLEIGTGNGTLLFALLDAGYSAEKLSGIDYSPGSIKLSKSIAATRGGELISFHLCDLLKEDPPLLPSMVGPDTWDLILDKGTFDAIALMEKDAKGVAPVSGYPSKVARLLKPGGHFLITCTLLLLESIRILHELIAILLVPACNFTEEELQTTFVNEQTCLSYHSRIQHPTYTYNGRTGSICASVAFKKPA